MRQVQTNKAFQSLQILQMPGKFVTVAPISLPLFNKSFQTWRGYFLQGVLSSRVDRFLLTYPFQKLNNCRRVI